MYITHNDIKKNNKAPLTRLLQLFTLMLLSFMSLASAIATELNTDHYTISHGGFKKDLNDHQQKNIINKNKAIEQADQFTGKASNKTRDVILNTDSRVRKASKNLISQHNSENYYADFAIYSATSFLQDDYDGDGFYQTFSVTFDADIYDYTDYQVGEVYALLYLSKNGGPWTHYYTTDNFLIEGDTDLDEYEVMTTFLSGYADDYYDVLIDLYEVGYSGVVATYSADDSNALYALSLESANYDEPYFEVIEITGGGSISLFILLIILTTLALRFRFNLHLNCRSNQT